MPSEHPKEEAIFDDFCSLHDDTIKIMDDVCRLKVRLLDLEEKYGREYQKATKKDC